MNKYDLILLDYYGTVVEEDDKVLSDIKRIIESDFSKEIAQQVFSNWYKEFVKLCLNSNKNNFITQTEIEYKSLSNSFSLANVDITNDYLASILSPLFSYWSSPNPYPDAINFIKNYKNQNNIIIVSNIDDQYINNSLSKLGISNIRCITSESVRSYKPQIDIFSKATEGLKVSKNKIVLIGDSLSLDKQGAENFDIDFIFINRRNKTIMDSAFHSISSFNELMYAD